jgi:hypothetical protein
MNARPASLLLVASAALAPAPASGETVVERKLTFAGMRFLRARLVDLDRPGTVGPVAMPAATPRLAAQD